MNFDYCADLLVRLERLAIEEPTWPEDAEARKVFDRLISESAARNEVEEPPPRYDERVVAYLDVLGSRSAVLTSSQSQEAFFSAAGQFGTIHGFLAHERVQREAGRTHVLATGFSDHVVLSAPAIGSGVRQLLESAHNLYGRLLCVNRRLVRGAVVLGNIFHEPGVIFGPALIKAYELESNATYPRIIATQEVIALCGGAHRLKTGNTPTRSPVMLPDGDMYFLDPLRSACASSSREDMRWHLSEATKSLLRETDESLREKGAWLAELLLRA